MTDASTEESAVVSSQSAAFILGDDYAVPGVRADGLTTQALLDGLSAHACVLDHQGRIVSVNQSWRTFARCNGGDGDGGYLGSDYLIAARQFDDGADRPDSFARQLEAVLRGQMPGFEYEYPCDAPTERRWFLAKVSVIPRTAPARVLVLHDNISALKGIQQNLARSEERYRLLFETVPQGVVFQDLDGHIASANPAALSILGLTLDQMQGRTSMDPRWRAVREDGSPFPGSEHPSMQAMRTGQVVDNVVMGIDAPGRGLAWIRIHAAPLWRADRMVGVYASFDDITAQRNAEAFQRLAIAVFEHAREGITVTDSDARILDVNPAFTRITGYTRDEALGQNPRILKSGRQDRVFYENMWHDLQQVGHWSGEIWNRRKDGEIYPETLSISAVRDPAGQVQQYVAMFTDITVRKRLEEEVHQMAFHDALTHLPNRRLLQDRLAQALLATQRSGRHGAVLMLDLDNFKPLNDTCGHATGDLLLIEVGERLRACVRAMDTVARLGGDEFVVVLGELSILREESEHMARRVAEKIRRSLGRAFKLRQADGAPVTHRCQASIGMTLFGSLPITTQELLRQADDAMYQAKQRGRNCVCLHTGPTQ